MFESWCSFLFSSLVSVQLLQRCWTSQVHINIFFLAPNVIRVQEWSCWAVICWERVRLSSRFHLSLTGSLMLWWEKLRPLRLWSGCRPHFLYLRILQVTFCCPRVCAVVPSSACLGLQLQNSANTSVHCDRNGWEEELISKMPTFKGVWQLRINLIII